MMTQEETIQFLSEPVAEYIDGADRYVYFRMEHRHPNINDVMNSEVGRLFQQYTQETLEEFVATLEDKYHAHYHAQIERLKAEIHQLKQPPFILQKKNIFETNHRRAAMQMKRDEEFIKSVSASYIRTKEDVLNAIGVPQPNNVVKIEEVTDFKRPSGNTLLENLYPELYV